MNRQQNAFMGCHPILQFFYFMAVIVTTVFVGHPVILAISFMGAIFYSLLLHGLRQVSKQLLWGVPMLIAVVVINTLFNHYGVTVLLYLHTGPITLEAVVYGIVLASMLWISIIWFSNMNVVMTTDRLLYLFSRLLPSISLVLSMVFRFVPRFTRQLAVIREGQKCIGKDIHGQNFMGKLRYALNELSMLVTWSLENGIDTADSMRARGYGVTKRTSFAIFQRETRDIVAGVLLFILYVVCMYGFAKGYAFARYNPRILIAGVSLTWSSVGFYLSWILFCMFPVLISAWDKMLFELRRFSF